MRIALSLAKKKSRSESVNLDQSRPRKIAQKTSEKCPKNWAKFQKFAQILIVRGSERSDDNPMSHKTEVVWLEKLE